MTQRFFFLCAIFLCITAHLSHAQDPLMHHPDDSAANTLYNQNSEENARARSEYFYNRVTFPEGSIPTGARAKAFQFSMEKMPLYNPSKRTSAQAAYEWKNVGPFNIGGRIIALAVNPKNPNTMFIGAADGGIWRSYDEGKTWQSVSDEFPTQAMGALAIDPVDTNIVYAGTGEANFAQHTFDGGGMFKSTNGGDTWTEIGIGTLPAYSRASDMVIDPTNHSTIYAAIPDGIRDPDQIGIYRSKDAGATWNLIFQGCTSDIVLNPQNPKILYTASSKVFGTGDAKHYGLFKSLDGGDTWAQLDIGVVDSLMGRTSIGISPSNPDVLYIGVSELTGDGRNWLIGVFKTADAGATWMKLPVPFDYMVSQGWYDNIIGVHPTNPDIVYAGGVKLIFSNDGGQNWTRVPDQGFGGIVHVDQHAIEFNPLYPDRVYIGNDGGFFIGSQNGTMWQKSDLGLSITQFIGGALHPTNDGFLLGGTQDNGTMTSTSAPMWDHVLYGDGGNGAINPLSPNILFTTKENLKFYRSEDYGQSWTMALGNVPLESSLFYIDFAMNMQNPSTLYLGTYRIYRTYNSGRTWAMINSCPFQTGQSCYYITAISVADYDSSVVLSGSTGGMVGISTDAGTSWNIITSPLPQAYCSAVKSFTPGTIYATYSRYGVEKVWRSTDWGNTWETISGNLPDIPVNDIIELDGKLIIGTDLGTFISDDGGTNWQRFGTGLPSLSVQKLRYNSTTGTLRAMTHGRGMFDMQWKTIASSAPLFISRPNTDMLEMGQPFTYAPVVTSHPPATFSLLDAPSGATIDAKLGFIHWSGGAKVGRFRVQASNSEGNATQEFTIATNDVVLKDWAIVSSSPMPSGVNAAWYAEDKSLWVARDSAGISRSLDGGVTWEHFTLPNTTTSVNGLHAFDKNIAVIGTRDGRILRTIDGGQTWATTLYGIDARFGNIRFSDRKLGVAVSQGAQDSADVFLTTNGGVDWEKQVFRTYARFPIDNTIHLYGGSDGWYASSNVGNSPATEANVNLTTDGGAVWRPRLGRTRNVASIGFIDRLNGFLVDDVRGTVCSTTNGGNLWRVAFYPMAGLRNVSVNTTWGSNVVWIVSDTSAWFSQDRGTTWRRTEMVVAGPIQTAVFADSLHGWVFSKSGIVQKLISDPLTSVEQHKASEKEMILGACYPNPLTTEDAAGTIRFSINSSAHVQLSVFNLAGMHLTTLVDETLSPGEYFTTWNAGPIGNGVYFYTMSAGTQSATGRIVVAK